MAEIILNAGNFETKVLQSDIPVLVVFWAIVYNKIDL